MQFRTVIACGVVLLALAAPAAAQSTLDAMTAPPPRQTPGRVAAGTATAGAATPAAAATPVGQTQPAPAAAGPARANGSRREETDAGRESEAVRRLQDGQYPGMQRLGSTVPLNQLQSAWDEPVPAPGQSAPGVLRFVVSGQPPQPAGQVDPVMQIRVRRYMETGIHLPPCEEVKEVHVGDSHVFRVANPSPGAVLVSARYEAADTNLRIVTASGRVYAFYVRSEGVTSRWLPDVEVFLTTDAPQSCGRPGRFADLPANDYLADLGIDLQALSLHSDEFRVYVGSPDHADIAPRAVASDGRSMLLDFGPRADTMRWPIVALREDGVDQPVNSRPIGKMGRILQVMAVGDLTLRSGQKVACIRRKGHLPVPEGVIIDSGLGRK